MKRVDFEVRKDFKEIQYFESAGIQLHCESILPKRCTVLL